MTQPQKAMHGSAVVLFLIAMVFYLLGGVTTFIVFGVLGVFVELAAWITLFGEAITKKDAE